LNTLEERLRDTPEDALVYARNRVNIDPLAEKGHIDVIRLLVALGRQREALRQYDYCREVLEAELGAKPSAELERALAAFKPPSSALVAPRPPAASAQSPLRVAEPALVGRDEECLALDEIAANAAASSVEPKLLLLSGEPGIGKSRLLRYCHQSVANLGGTVLVARAFEAEMRGPFGIWADIFKSVRTSTISAATRAQLAPLILDAGAPAPKESDRFQLFAAVVALLAELAKRAPIAVLIDDLQWVDEPSVSLLHYVIRASDAPCDLYWARRCGHRAEHEEHHCFRMHSDISR
jgi:hypothetical protein